MSFIAPASVDGEQVGSFSSPGIAHESKQVLRLFVRHQVTIDHVKYYRKKRAGASRQIQ